jgi:hypothetical protein
MAFISYPNPPRHTAIALSPIDIYAENESEFTGRQQIVDIGVGWWEGTVSVRAMLDTQANRWRGFFSSCRGAVNTFAVQLIDVPTGARNGAVDGGAALGAQQVPLRGLPANSAVAGFGEYVTLAGRLYMLAAALVSDGAGEATATLTRPLAGAVADGNVAYISNAYIVARLAAPPPPVVSGLNGWAEPFSFSIKEAI